jgi:hypothetical protein
MRSFPRILILVSLLTAVLLPAVAYAAGPFYTSTNGRTGGAGTPGDPEKAATIGEVLAICQKHYGVSDIIYWYNANYDYYCEFVPAPNDCVAKNCPGGQPPGTGVDLPYPLVIGGLIGLGVLLLGAGWFLRQRRFRPA